MTQSQLSQELALSYGWISHCVAAGKLDGCFVGEGRARKFDLVQSALALGIALPVESVRQKNALRQEKRDRMAAERARIKVIEDESRNYRLQNYSSC